MARRQPLQCAATLAAAALCVGCSSGVYNYALPEGPRYTGAPALRVAAAAAPDDTLRVVSFNIAWSRYVDRAIVVLAAEPQLSNADVILLQEMDAPGTQRVAEALGMFYVYYPATLHPRTERDFGNAVLSRWPIVADAKILLPHIARFRGTRRAATAATIRVGTSDVRVYSAHLGTIAEIGPGARREQLRAILADAAPHERVIIGGDMNDPGVGRIADDTGYDWPTKEGPRTAMVGRLDHIFVRGFRSAGSGTVLNNRGASDHRPVWAVGLLR